MSIMEQAKTHMTHSTSNSRLDDLGQCWYEYDQFEEVPINVRFNVMRVGDGKVQYWLKNDKGISSQYIANEDNKCIYDSNFSSSGIPAVFKGKGLSTFDPLLYNEQLLSKEAVNRAKGYIKHFEEFAKDGMGLFIYSKSESSGKTHLVSAIANEIMGRYKESIKFVRAVNFFSEMKRNISADKNGDPYARSNIFDSTIRANILIIDDIGAGAQSSYISDLVYELVNKRVQQNKVTLFTSKRSFSELAYDNSTLMIIQQKCLKLPLPNENIGKVLIKENNSKYEQLLNS